jgi:predicted PurR-regulated permease PerM
VTHPEPHVSRLRVEIAPKTVALILGVIGGIWLLGQLTAVLSIVLVALVLVGTFDPIVGWIERRGLPRGRALVLVFVVATLALVGLVLLMVPPLVAQLVDVIENAPRERERIVLALEGYSWARPVIKALQELPLEDIGARAGAELIGYSTSLVVAIGYGISTLFLAIYLLADPMRSKGLVYSVIPRRHHIKLAKILLELKKIVGGYMRGQLITSLSIGVFVFLLLTVLGAENALAIALFAALTDIIPFVGGYIASTPVILAVTPQGTSTTLIVIGVMFVYQEFETRLLVPRVYGRTLRLPPAIVLVALLVGATLGGILGALLALPITAGLQMVLRELHLALPGEALAVGPADKLDEHASEIYEQLTEGVPAADAGVIADDLATIVKQTEAGMQAEANQRAQSGRSATPLKLPLLGTAPKPA